VQPYVPGETQVARFAGGAGDHRVCQHHRHRRRGFVAELSLYLEVLSGIVSGSVTVCHPWFFGIPSPPMVAGAPLPANKNLFIGLVAVYGGMVIMLQAWIALIRIARRHRGLPVRSFVAVFARGRRRSWSSRRCSAGTPTATRPRAR